MRRPASPGSGNLGHYPRTVGGGPSRRTRITRSLKDVAEFIEFLTELAELKNPNFIVELQGTSVGIAPDRPNDSVVTSFVSISNLGAPSVAREWRVSVTRPGSTEAINAIAIIPPLQGRVILERENQPPVTIPATEELASKTAQNPIARGEARVGYLLFMVEGIPGTVLREEKKALTVTAKDIPGREYSAVKQRSGVPGAAPYVPGLPLR
jgi:hypothetical protein